MSRFNPNDKSMIDPNKQYPKEYQEFMSSFGYWDLYGTWGMIMEEYTIIDEEEVDRIIAKRH